MGKSVTTEVELNGNAFSNLNDTNLDKTGINDFGYKEKRAKVISGISDTCDINNIP